jgi:hypothetical protein
LDAVIPVADTKEAMSGIERDLGDEVLDALAGMPYAMGYTGVVASSRRSVAVRPVRKLSMT